MGLLTSETEQGPVSIDLYSDQAFELLSALWLKVGWNQKYTYTFSWLGRPVIQLPEDLLRLQEVIYRVKPDVVVETGVAHGGSAVFYASLLKAIGRGRVIGIDIRIRPENRRAIEAHELARLIALIEGSSTERAVVDEVSSMVSAGESVLVVLDSRHDKAHVLEELKQYAPLVTPGSYIIATDGLMRDLHDVPRGRPNWAHDNPAAAAVEFAREHPEFAAEPPQWSFNESTLTENVTHWPDAWLRRV
ncbi:MAG: class I SAM-dependent methyltransferase [Chloroflexi bacterium]|nr:class I SAM-dependent methyltransferase [Chloroflexota bacterium]